MNWSKKHDRCVACNDTKYRHVGRGLCRPCYHQKYAAAHQTKMKQYRTDWYERQGGKDYAKARRESAHFDGVREQVLRRDDYKCTRCPNTSGLIVDHIDGNGRGKPKPNNDLNNLQTLCRKCHKDKHHADLQRGRGFATPGENKWSAKYGLDSCRECDRSDRPHNAKGLCKICYNKTKI